MKLAGALMTVLFLSGFSPGDGAPDWAETSEKSLQFVESLTNMASAHRKDASGAVNALSKWNKSFSKFSKFASSLGTAFALAGVIAGMLDDSDQRRHDELLREFNKVHEGIKDLKKMFGDLKFLIKDEHAKTRIDGYFVSMAGVVHKMHLYNANPTLYRKEMSDYWERNTIYNALFGIYSSLVDDYISNSLIDTQYEQTRGDWMQINNLRIYITVLLIEGHEAYTLSCMLYEQDENNKSQNEAKEICYIKADDFKDHEEKFNNKFQNVLDLCKKDWRKNLKMDMEEIFRTHGGGKSNEEIGNIVQNKIISKFFWIDATIVVYNGIWDGKNHWVLADEFKFRDHTKNWCLMLRNKPGYRDPFIRSLSTNPLRFRTKTEIELIFPEGNKNLKYLPLVLGARMVHKIIEGNLKENGITYNGLAVVKHGSGLWALTTSSEQHFFLNIGGYSVIISLPDYSFYKECPAEFPYAFSEGSYCRKSLVTNKDTWFDKRYYLSEGYVNCPSVPCRNYVIPFDLSKTVFEQFAQIGGFFGKY